MLADIAAIYRASKKRKDINAFTQYVARPPAAVLVWMLKGTPLTPNQVTLLATVVCAGAAAILVTWLSWLGLVVAAAVFEFSFVLDCVDGMLARLRKIASPLGHLLDFLMDELKAMLIYGCVAVRLWQQQDDERLLVVGLAGLFCLASGIALTSFMRRPEYSGKTPTEDGQPAEVGGRRGPIGLAVSGLEWAARIVVHYPQYFWICALANRIDVYFWAYGAVNVLYLGLSLLKITVRMGRFAKPAAAPAEVTP